MATQTVEFVAPSGLTLTAKVFAIASDVEVDSVVATEATNRKGVYLAAYTDLPAAEYLLDALYGTASVAVWEVVTLADTATYEAVERGFRSVPGSEAAEDIAEILSLLSNPIVQVKTEDYHDQYVKVHRGADYNSVGVAHSKKRWLVDANDTDLTGFTAGSFVVVDRLDGSAAFSVTTVEVFDAAGPNQAVLVTLVESDTSSLGVGAQYTFKLTVTDGTSSFVPGEGTFEVLS